MLLPDELGSPADRRNRWSSILVVGADGSLTQSRNTIGVSNQLAAGGALIVDGQVACNVGRHSASGLLQIEEGASRIDPQEGEPMPVVKTRDDLRLDLLYTCYVEPWLGPYVRAGGETSNLRLGLGLRQNRYENTWVVEDVDRTLLLRAMPESGTACKPPWGPHPTRPCPAELHSAPRSAEGATI